ncbi:MAG TPA: hypothetical protein PLP01_10225, partial [Phycisphaerae bacterium]|nr:hypothetical protein [Phycisphaerae bacterium]
SQVDCVMWVDGERITKNGDGYVWESTTVWNDRVVLNFKARIDANGNPVAGVVNCFGLGFMPMDRAYLPEYAADSFDRDDWIAS